MWGWDPSTTERNVDRLLRWQLLMGILLVVAAPAVAAQSPARVSTRSPHGNLNIACQNCHTFTSWKPIRQAAEFDHDKTSFPLRGLHEKVGCTQCHTSMVFSNAGTSCASCHADIHRRQMGANCESCHSVKGWQVSLQTVRQHQNRFPLIGAHATLECASCHTGAAVGRFQGLPTDCVACHSAAYTGTRSPNHQSAGFPTSCQSCHTMNSWLGAKFDHAAFTGFALTGAHAQLDCTTCHQGGHYQGTSANCYSCHVADYTRASNPDHVQAMFPQTCSQCHTMTTWQGARFDHNLFTQFPLSGAHATVGCTQCHAGGRYAGTPSDCKSCHLTDYQQTTNPNHEAAGFPQDCSICHTSVQWMGARFDHARTRFPLTGAHTGLTCMSCHSSGTYSGLSTTCVSCHLAKYQATTNPGHIAAGFPQQCEVCHATTAWTPASFNHSTTAFPLTGAHTSVACANCHVGGRYAGTPTDCYACHQTDFTGTTNPSHTAAGFPTTCTTCHTTSTWLGARFDHTWFPIYSGAHAGKWATCNDCHTNPTNFKAFSCLTCHQHEKTIMDEKHREVPSYVYNSPNCYACHPLGRS